MLLTVFPFCELLTVFCFQISKNVRITLTHVMTMPSARILLAPTDALAVLDSKATEDNAVVRKDVLRHTP